MLNAIGDLFGVAILATFKVIMGLSFVTLISWLANSYWAEIIEFSI
ncbi:putative membrane protein [Brucella rhizosphaerae]|uniref:Putative membrane protein n=1 Tax=Brucella rhizosphaerae TaxID=571254 RepID=A0A256FXN1_9HYPH|nr:putative membrane protein [Brucella rhizosphaerae]